MRCRCLATGSCVVYCRPHDDTDLAACNFQAQINPIHTSPAVVPLFLVSLRRSCTVLYCPLPAQYAGVDEKGAEEERRAG